MKLPSSILSILGLALAIQQAPVAQASVSRGLSGESTAEPFPEDDDQRTQSPDPGLPSGETPANDMCADAQVVQVGDQLVASTDAATTGQADTCGSFSPEFSFFGPGNATGVWFAIEGTGGGLEAEVNATYDMQVAVYTGSCDELACVDGTAGDPPRWDYGDIKWGSKEGVMYYILVAGWEGDVGDFTLSIYEGEEPENTDCAAAVPLTIGETYEDGTTEFATIPDEGDFPACTIGEFLNGITAPTVWFSVVGNGEITQFSLVADYDGWISIYKGDSCDELECINSNDDSPLNDGSESVIAQPLEEGATYFINVHGYEKSYGNFGIESKTLEPVANDMCSDAEPLELGVNASSSSLAATADPGLPECGLGTNESSIGVWYTMEGTGNPVQIRLEGSGFNLELHFSIYTGSCDDLVCAGNQFVGFLPFTWDTVEGETYNIYVYGRTRALSDIFTIITEEVERPANDMCEDAVPLVLNEVVSGTTLASSADEGLETCGDVIGLGFGGVWYSFEGNGDRRLVGVSSGSNGTGFFDTILSVYEGDCGSLTCVGGDDQGQGFLEYENVVLIDTVEGTMYYAYVHGFGLSRGDFEIAEIGIPRPENDACEDATPLELGDNVEGSTQFAGTDMVDIESCGTSQFGNDTAPGLWYTVVGEGFAVQASVNAQYDFQMTVFSGDCDALECVDGTEGNEGDFFNGGLIWTAEEGVTYTVLVHGYNGGVGSFDLFYETAIF
ncbi:PKD [Seminavis robusta]|uniref:PKD n=1 Tax=Seminavis robusta TaxID=568900 RepID=A0A9N8H937_9STRA|nr:PKD [Seminavis robusta]|eukprot:Sro262_g102010.1 PKD (729) ;mRNA; f:37536-40088